MVPLALFVLDIVVKPQFEGLPSNVTSGISTLTNNLAAVLLMASGLGIVLSILGMLFGHWLGFHQLSERSRSSLILSASSGALLYVAVAAANYATVLFR